MQNRRNWAVICGNFRNPFELKLTLAKITDMRSRGLFEGVILSTWKGECENIPGIREELSQFDIKLIESDLPSKEQIGTLQNYGIALQKEQLRKGCLYVPDGCYVLKCRTDKTFIKLSLFEPFLSGDYDFSISELGNFKSVFSHRMLCHHFNYLNGIMPRDLIFYGHKFDIERFSIARMSNICSIAGNVESHFFNDKFLLNYEIAYDYAKYINVPIMLSKFANYTKNTPDSEFFIPKFFNRFIALMFAFINTNLIVFNADSSKDNMSFRELLIQNFGGIPTFIIGSETVTRIINNNNVKKTRAYEEFLEEFWIIKSKGFTGGMTEEEYNECCIFGREKLNLEPEQWLHRSLPFVKHSAIIKTNNNYDFNTISQKFFPDIDIDFLEYLNRPKGNFYNDIEYNIDLFKTTQSYWTMLIHGAVSAQFKTTYLLVKHYLKGELPENLKDTAYTAIEKAVSWPSFINAKISEYKLLFYWYYFQLKENPITKYNNLLLNILRDFKYTDIENSEIRKNPDINYHSELLTQCKLFLQKQQEREEFDYRTYILYKFLEEIECNDKYYPQSGDLNCLINNSDFVLLLQLIKDFSLVYKNIEGLKFDLQCAEYLFKFGRSEIGEWYLLQTGLQAPTEDRLYLMFKYAKAAKDIFPATFFATGELTDTFLLLLTNISENLKSNPDSDISQMLESANLSMCEENKFFMLLQTLLSFGVIGKFSEQLTKSVDNKKKLFAVALYAEFEKNNDIEFFTVKSNIEFWVHSLTIKNHPKIKKIGVSLDWMNDDINSDSIFASYFRYVGKNVRLNFEFGPTIPQSDFSKWKLCKEIFSKTQYFTNSYALWFKDYPVVDTANFADFQNIVQLAVADFIKAKEELLRVIS
ncbi:MAG: hypothetical protein LBM93_12290 [Oscillospiraceae bacterium]|jgi:hypothetical protein|nr:hypothetical protein [Oscillospiraceae bacterium]